MSGLTNRLFIHARIALGRHPVASPGTLDKRAWLLKSSATTAEVVSSISTASDPFERLRPVLGRARRGFPTLLLSLTLGRPTRKCVMSGHEPGAPGADP